jgi:nucleosome binding factor SPN SPT16 subunit
MSIGNVELKILRKTSLLVENVDFVFIFKTRKKIIIGRGRFKMLYILLRN